ncbi:MAG: TraX family protein [Candidatus Faecousia sp.]|nr:TraX family protein [Candidatus Faecousia sp.]
MRDLRDRRKLPHVEVTAATLKWYGCATMFFYSLSMTVVQNGLLHVNQFSNTQLREMWAANPDLMVLSSWAAMFQLLGGLAIPVFAFLLVEGFLHTRNFKVYLIRMVGFALLSEIPFDLAMSGRIFGWDSQNLLFTLAIGLVMLYGLRLFAAGKGVKLLIVLAAVLWSVLMKTQFGLCMVLLIAVYYLLKEHKAKLWVSGIISLMYVTGPVSNFVLKRYNHQRGEQPNKYLFYILYPLHLLILGTITRCITS